MRIDAILKSAFDEGRIDVTLMAGFRPVAETETKGRKFLTDHVDALSREDVIEIMDELLEHKGLNPSEFGHMFPYTDLEFSDYKVLYSRDWALFMRVSKLAAVAG